MSSDSKKRAYDQTIKTIEDNEDSNIFLLQNLFEAISETGLRLKKIQIPEEKKEIVQWKQKVEKFFDRYCSVASEGDLQAKTYDHHALGMTSQIGKAVCEMSNLLDKIEASFEACQFEMWKSGRLRRNTCIYLSSLLTWMEGGILDDRVVPDEYMDSDYYLYHTGLFVNPHSEPFKHAIPTTEDEKKQQRRELCQKLIEFWHLDEVLDETDLLISGM